MEKIEKLKIGNYVLTFDIFFSKSINYCGEDVCIDHCKGSKTFKNIEAYNRFLDHLHYSLHTYSFHRDTIIYGDFVINLIHDSSLTISYEVYNNRELSCRYYEITGDKEWSE